VESGVGRVIPTPERGYIERRWQPWNRLLAAILLAFGVLGVAGAGASPRTTSVAPSAHGSADDATSRATYSSRDATPVGGLSAAFGPLSANAELLTAASLGRGLVAWGANERGQLGNGTTKNSDVPVRVCAVGVKECPGGPYLEEVTAVAGGYNHSLALLPSGQVAAWGSNNFGQLGDGIPAHEQLPAPSDAPVRVCAIGVTECAAGPFLEEVAAVSAGEDYSLALLESGTVVAWGYNELGELGNGTTTSRPVPVKVCAVGVKECPGGPYLENVAAIAGGGLHSLARLTNGQVVAWGPNELGQLGNGTTTRSSVPVNVCAVGVTECPGGPYLENVATIAANLNHSLASLKSGAALAWGRNTSGQLGNGTTKNSDVPIQICAVGVKECPGGPYLEGVEAVVGGTGEADGMALLTSGQVVAWGANSFGELGDGSTQESHTPVRVCAAGVQECANGPYLEAVTAIASGRSYAVARVESGSVMAWGAGSNGQLGNGTTTERQLVPVAVTGLSEATTAAGGGEHGLASAVACIVPAITKVEPTLGSPGGGTRVTITGVGLLNEAAIVRFGSARATELKAESEAKLVVTSPPGTGTVDVTVQTPCGTSAINRPGDQFNYGPTVTKLEPAEGPPAGGTAVAITGTNFNEVKAVRFGTAAASEVKTESPTRITATSPAGSSVVDVTVETAGGTSPTTPADRFNYGPAVTKLEPAEGPPAGGTAVAITGTSFNEVKAVRFGTAAASEVKTESPTRITATSPRGSGVVDVTVETAGGTSPTNSADRFTYIPEAVLQLYSNNVQMTTRRVGFVAWGPLKFVSETMGAEVECVNMGFGYLNNEGTPTTGHGAIESWNGQGDASSMGTETRRTCQYKQSGISAAEAWVTDEPPLRESEPPGLGRTRTTPLSQPTNLEVSCDLGEVGKNALVRIGILSSLARPPASCETEAERGEEITKEEAERVGCYKAASERPPEGCVGFTIVVPAMAEEFGVYGTLQPRLRNGFTNSLHPSSWLFEGVAVGALHLLGNFADRFVPSGESKLVGFGSLQLIIAK
jgi:alpha-tubulin suppressor-like RCC1 family protein